ncbi:transcriptional regulator with PAS, ATPase and Fis domain [Caldanaerobacter subterraneus subsp. tengcongensis MB4]|nr:sigma 54-interacting transcriptional regulator [Caldanaerobacter subterraneus]MCS3916952.1 transcriptional regulator with PAS, ATPase and Fis domain [Caldanaerobacter subterraneus subsp. tengcongensis MB4]
MDNILEEIKNDLQSIAETIKAITNVDVTIVDEKLKRIAGTGPFKEKIGRYAPKNSAFEKALKTGRQYFIVNPGKHPICASCEEHQNCKEELELCIPIRNGEKIIGILGMSIFDKNTKIDFLNKQEDFKNFEKRFSELITTKINEKKLGVMIEYRSSELMTLINSINEGIIILDSQNRVVTVNKYLKEKLNVSEKTPVKSIFPVKLLQELEKKDFEGEVGPVEIKGIKFVINSSPIAVKGQRVGTVLVFSDFSKMQESVYKASKMSEIVTFDDIVGESDAIKYAKSQAIQIADSEVPVLLLGESGTGKELFARAIHFQSSRKNEIFMPINCGAIPETLIESELFGYEKGSFTGANVTGKIGKFELAKDGTIFLDEIGDLPLSMQVKLLRALEEKEIVRIGGYTPIKVNPRIISATHKDLYQMVLEGKFREDLFYRLNVVPIVIPPLRERGYDIIILANYFLEKFNKIYGKNIKGFSKESEKLLLSYPFPGNIRELRNLIEYAVNFESKDYISPETINQRLHRKTLEEGKTLAEMVKNYEKNVIKEYMLRYGSDVESKKLIAKKLGISIATLYRKMAEE